MVEPNAGKAEAEGGEASRVRLVFAVVVAVVLGVLVVVVVASSGGSSIEQAAAPAPEECVQSWNDNRYALSQGRHNRAFHRYDGAQVGYLATEGVPAVTGDPAAGPCVVVFPREQLDPEPVAAGYRDYGSDWASLNLDYDPDTLASLQAAALGGVNTSLNEDGKLTPQ